jgi:hypothetical protein
MYEVGIFYDNLVYFMAIGNIVWPFEIFYGPLVCFTKTNLATLAILLL